MNNYDDKIITIKENQKKLLILAKNKIEEESHIFNFNTKNIVDVLNHSAVVTKKYEAIIEAQRLIETYTNEIKNATTVEEILEIRKGLNKCINKIKKEMVNRGIDDYEYNRYCDEASRLRKTISMNIRFLKRENKINEIESLNDNIDYLCEEDKLRLQKLVKNELSYGKRNLEKYNSFDDTRVVEYQKENKEEIREEIKEEKVVNTKKPLKKIDINLPKIERKNVVDMEAFDNVHDFLDYRVDTIEKQYNISKIDEYNGGIVKNLKIFVNNLPKLKNNLAVSGRMNVEYNLFCRRPELLGYSQYISQHSSIGYNFKKALRNSSLKNKENDYQEEHDRIIDWIIDFCNDNNLEIKYNKRIGTYK